MLVDHFTRACGSVFSYFIADGSVADCTKRRYLVNVKVFFRFSSKNFLAEARQTKYLPQALGHIAIKISTCI